MAQWNTVDLPYQPSIVKNWRHGGIFLTLHMQRGPSGIQNAVFHWLCFAWNRHWSKLLSGWLIIRNGSSYTTLTFMTHLWWKTSKIGITLVPASSYGQIWPLQAKRYISNGIGKLFHTQIWPSKYLYVLHLPTDGDGHGHSYHQWEADPLLDVPRWWSTCWVEEQLYLAGHN